MSVDSVKRDYIPNVEIGQLATGTANFAEFKTQAGIYGEYCIFVQQKRYEWIQAITTTET